jgi:FdhD protein
VHNVALANTPGEVLAVRADIGRHNALDKLYGHCLRQQIATGDLLAVLSGRISSEILLKAAKLGLPMVLSKSAPTELALALADEIGITVIGFARQDRLNVYTHPERVVV